MGYEMRLSRSAEMGYSCWSCYIVYVEPGKPEVIVASVGQGLQTERNRQVYIKDAARRIRILEEYYAKTGKRQEVVAEQNMQEWEARALESAWMRAGGSG